MNQKQRIHSIDIVRGLIMIIMTLDHSRDFLHFAGNPPLNLQSTTVVLFFTRWITHYCAPTFLFLGGVSAFLAGQRRTKTELSRFLFKRGLWLVVSDLLIISLLFTFDLEYHVLVLEVLWASGVGMMLLALMVRLPIQAIGAIAIAVIFGHNILDYIQIPKTGAGGIAATFLMTAFGSFIPIGGDRIVAVLYAAVPWSAALWLGYFFGRLYGKDFNTQKRRRILLSWGGIFIALFIVIRAINHYGDPSQWSPQRNMVFTILSFLNVSKQVPSLLFMLVTLGPVMILLALVEKTGNRFAEICRVYGNVPYFYFIAHLSLLRIINILLIALQGLPLKSAPDAFLVWQAPDFGVPLWGVYVFWIATAAILYFPCKWYGKYKLSHTHWWLSYV